MVTSFEVDFNLECSSVTQIVLEIEILLFNCYGIVNWFHSLISNLFSLRFNQLGNIRDGVSFLD